MDDKTLLELAAKAAGVPPLDMHDLYHHPDDGGELYHKAWNPLTDDGDALRLAVKLQLQIEHCDYEVVVTEKEYDSGNPIGAAENNAHNPYAATRRAIVRAAAAIAEQGEKE